jgi:hypothetical protein
VARRAEESHDRFADQTSTSRHEHSHRPRSGPGIEKVTWQIWLTDPRLFLVAIGLEVAI